MLGVRLWTGQGTPGTGRYMHSAMNELEKHFSGNAPQSFYDHLASCQECREEVAAMDECALVLRELGDPGAAPEPRLGFYNRVAGEIVEHQRKEAWGLFSPGFTFFRRVAFASLLVLAGLGSYLVANESSFVVGSGTDAATIMASHDSSADHAESSDRDRLLVTLAT